ncbi:MAG TPA: alpha/beta fold hydrolase [Stellaceae bacterium]|nr:alpha/beta fold hydrolase [Stellaceae bacterium]
MPAADHETRAALHVPAPQDAALGTPFVAADGARLPMRRWLPEGKTRAVVLALHGFNDYSNAFAAAGPVFAAEGFALYAYDQRGFGAAPAPGCWAGSRAMIDDALGAMQWLRERHPGVPVYLMGESMGAAVAELTANRAGHGPAAPDGVVLLAPAVWGRDTMNVFERAGLWLADLMPSIRWSPSLIPVKIRASDNIAMLRVLGADPLVIKETRSDTLNGLVDLMGQALAEAPRFSARALILYGEQDQIVPRHAVERFVAELPPGAGPRQRVALYPEGYHLLLRDLDGARVVDDVLAWIGAPDAPLPSGDDAGARERLAGRTVPIPASAPAAGLAAPLGRSPS